MTTQNPANEIPIVIKPAGEQKVKIGRRSSDRQSTELRVKKDGESIEAIQVKCKCGEHIEIKCLYSEPN